MKTVVGVVVVCLVLAVAVAGWALGALRSSASAAPTRLDLGPSRFGQEGLRVSGTAVLRAAPELATVRLGYESRARRAREAKVLNDRVMRKVLAAIENEGVARKDVQTVEYRLFPVWEWDTTNTKALFWHVLNMVEVRVRRVGTTADVIDAASAAGADKVSDVQFSVDSLHKLRTRAREMAAKVAREKAEQLARLMGARLGKVVAVNDTGPYWSYRSSYGASNVGQEAAEVPAATAAADSVVRGGQIVVEAREDLVFALEPAEAS